MFKDVEIENSILLNVIYTNDNISILLDCNMCENDFTLPENKKIFTFLKSSYEKNVSVDLKIVKMNFSFSDLYFEQLETSNSMIDVKSYCKILQELRKKRELENILCESVKKLNYLTYDDIHDHLNSKLYNINSETVSKNNQINFRNYLDRFNKNYDNFLLTGFKKVDINFKFKLGSLNIIGARPGVGKTTFAINLLKNMLVQNKCIFISLEMNAFDIIDRFVCCSEDLKLSTIVNKKLDNFVMTKINQCFCNLIEKKLFLIECFSENIDLLILKIKKEVKEQQIKVIFIDYLQLLIAKNNKEIRYLQLAEITRKLKILALELNIVIIALSQVNRKSDERSNNKLFLSDLRESGSIEQDADTVMFLYNKKNDYDENKIVVLDVVKNRNGVLFSTDFVFKTDKCQFIEM
ncbi:replicative DNA helicase [Campylobacter canadensis]|uniref:replicative DNA helicase n=1 Tax=Campylobacter canadensis TaxID=449520 RepID=UPI001CCC4B5C|nr:DnaB-like helicase C-terminal domain-containing protein [Campylobacter canadensis]MBZ8002650.1 hypothetical protein [Campylobacter canadensis]